MLNFDSILKENQTLICAILNITPDSFSDGNANLALDSVLDKANQFYKDGASILDIGAESTRPNSVLLTANQEIERLKPVLNALNESYLLPLSIDTWKSEVANFSLQNGASIINDITGLFGDSDMAEVISQHQANVVLMFNAAITRPNHELSKAFPIFQVEQKNPNPIFTPEEYDCFSSLSIIDLAKYSLEKSIQIALDNGIKENQMILDPGIGFAQSHHEMLTLMQNLDSLKSFGFPLFLGVSRKRMIGTILENNHLPYELSTKEGLHNRDLGTAMYTFYASMNGVEVVRTHTVKEHKLACAFAESLLTNPNK